MYRSGIPVKRIAAVARVAPSGIRLHLARAAEQDPELRAAHRAAATPDPKRVTGPAMNFAFEKQT